MSELNPICQKLEKLKNAGCPYEVMCAQAELNYHTFRQAFQRNKITKMVMLSLLRAGIIKDGDKIEYDKWARENAKPKKRRKRIEKDDEQKAAV